MAALAVDMCIRFFNRERFYCLTIMSESYKFFDVNKTNSVQSVKASFIR